MESLRVKEGCELPALSIIPDEAVSIRKGWINTYFPNKSHEIKRSLSPENI
jgi:hypothetical protein